MTVADSQDQGASKPRPVRVGFDPAMAGKSAECDGGGPVPGGRYAARQDFAGVLTGEYLDHGDPPSRWYLLAELTEKPESYTDDRVWCESGNLFLVEKR